jgi:disulfide bond formation protein DsbB
VGSFLSVTSSDILAGSGGFPLTLRQIGIAVAVLSALGVGSALAIEHIGGIPPCPLCLDQRIAYYAAIPLAALAVLLARSAPLWSRLLLAVVAAGFLFNAGLGVYHAGIEWGFWPGPDACSGMAPLATSADALLESLKKPSVVRCDAAALRILGISLAGYSALLSVFLAGLAMAGWKARAA